MSGKEASLFDREPEMTTTALAPWFGSNRMLAPIVGKELRGCKWVGVPFAGGMSELAHIKASTIVVSDLHRHVINLARTVQQSDFRGLLIDELNDTPFHPDALAQRSGRGQSIEAKTSKPQMPNVTWAYNYFVACWMGRSHKAGIDDEFNGGLSIRWNANGGDSNKRYRSAVASLDAWGEIMRRCNFSVLDCFEFLDRCEDSEGHGIYCDPPFPGPGDRYKHNSPRRSIASWRPSWRRSN
jgi:DNA adenine methylase